MTLIVALIAAMLAGVSLGQYPVAPVRVFAILTGAQLDLTYTPIDERIVTLVRGPRILLVALCGAGLSLAGAALQGVFRNPLSSPEMLGISAGAGFGGAVAILLGASGLILTTSAFATGLLALLLVGAVARIGGRPDTTTVILAGVIVGAFFSALISVTQMLADPHNSLPAIVFWLMGSFAAASWYHLAIAAPPVVLGSVVLWLMRFRINVLSLGDEEARSLGVNVERDRWLVFLAVALITGATVSVAGIIGWVGLVVPHLARLLAGHDHRHLLPVSCLMGAAYICFIDTVARSATVAEIPLGVLTALLGAPFVAVIMGRLRRNMEAQR
ncbi:FecCD family ABC transporter permease [Ensifer adhaerens]|uniref:FecCD family ABC transporter permease n=1 Tax=Ensifer adhaerens TaxID=106592 RepID=UPI003D03953B